MATLRLSWRGNAGDARGWYASTLADKVTGRYARWQRDAAAATSAYERWAAAPTGELGWRYATYLGMLDREESSARSYAAAVARLERWLRRP